MWRRTDIPIRRARGADGFLIASDAGPPKQGAVANGYSVHELSAALTSIAAQHVFLFFNSCFSGAMLPEPTRANDGVLAGKPVLALSKETAAWTLDLLAHNARLVLTAGNASQSVPDVDNPFSAAVVDALNGAADADGDGLILGTEIAQFVRGRVARATRLAGHANDPVFAVLPKLVPPVDPRPDVPDPGRIDYALQGDFIFLAPGGPKASAEAGISEQQALLTDKQSRLSSGQFLACVDCPTMVKLPGDPGTGACLDRNHLWPVGRLLSRDGMPPLSRRRWLRPRRPPRRQHDLARRAGIHHVADKQIDRAVSPASTTVCRPPPSGPPLPPTVPPARHLGQRRCRWPAGLLGLRCR